MLNACLLLRSPRDTRHTQNSPSSLLMLQKSQDPATIQPPQRRPSKNHISRKLPSLSFLLKKHFFHTWSFSPSCPDPTELANCPRESLWLTKLEDQRMWWITPCEFHLCCLTAPASAQGSLICFWVFTNTTPFFPLNHLRVKRLSSQVLCFQHSKYDSLNSTAPDHRQTQGQGRVYGDVKSQVD